MLSLVRLLLRGLLCVHSLFRHQQKIVFLPYKQLLRFQLHKGPLPLPLMGSLCAWNIQGLNWPNKQEDLKVFLQSYQIDFIGLLETKIKQAKVDYIASNVFRGWRWSHNFSAGDHGRIFIAWRPQRYRMTVLTFSAQHLHCRLEDFLVSTTFLLTFVYGFNQEGAQESLWHSLLEIAEDLEEPWCIVGDFNSVLYTHDRIGGTSILATEIQEFADTVRDCGLAELPFHGPYYSWTNKTVWSRIDRVFVNTY